MRGIEGEQVLMRIFLGRPRTASHRPLWAQVLDLLRAEGIAGATVFKGIAGFGHLHQVHTTSLEVLSGDLPLVVEVVDSQEHLDRVLPALGALMVGGAIMTERAHVIRYTARGS
jgi:PII-like signaling protein